MTSSPRHPGVPGPIPDTTAITVRPASASDGMHATTVLADRWRPGGNRRSFVAVDAGATLLGHCRAVDNAFHPASRILLLECSDGGWDAGAADALLAAQVGVSERPLRMKLGHADVREAALAVRFGAVVEQLCPPCRRVVGAELRDWAAHHRGGTEPVREGDADELRELWVDHYVDQHAAWSSAAPREVLLREWQDDFTVGSLGCFDARRSTLLRRDTRVVAAALVWPDDEPEVTLVSRPHRGAASVRDRLACLAAVVDASADGDVLLVDSHLTEADEFEMMRGVPGLVDDTGWCALVAIPVPGGVDPRPLDTRLVPPEVFTTTLGMLLPEPPPAGRP